MSVHWIDIALRLSRYRLNDLLVRRARTERVTDLVNLDRVRGLLRTIYWRRRFLASRDERSRTLNAEAEGIPAIVLEPVPATPPQGEMDDPFGKHATPSPPLSHESANSPENKSGPFYSPSFAANRHSPSLSVSSQPRQHRPTLGRSPSNSSMLSSEDAHHRR